MGKLGYLPCAHTPRAQCFRSVGPTEDWMNRWERKFGVRLSAKARDILDDVKRHRPINLPHTEKVK